VPGGAPGAARSQALLVAGERVRSSSHVPVRETPARGMLLLRRSDASCPRSLGRRVGRPRGRAVPLPARPPRRAPGRAGQAAEPRGGPLSGRRAHLHPEHDRGPNFGFTKKGHWFRFRLVSRSSAPRPSSRDPATPSSTTSVLRGQGRARHQATHRRRRLSPWWKDRPPLQTSSFALYSNQGRASDLPSDPHQGLAPVPLDLWTNEAFVAHAQDQQLFYGIVAASSSS